MLPINITLLYEEKKQEQQELDVINDLPDINTNLESYGKWDGLLNEAPLKEY